MFQIYTHLFIHMCLSNDALQCKCPPMYSTRPYLMSSYLFYFGTKFGPIFNLNYQAIFTHANIHNLRVFAAVMSKLSQLSQGSIAPRHSDADNIHFEIPYFFQVLPLQMDFLSVIYSLTSGTGKIYVKRHDSWSIHRQC